MEQLEADDLFSQVRTAHRLLAGYYQRLFATINNTAIELKVNFHGWYPTQHSRPSGKSVNPLTNRWAWDLLPANCAIYTFTDSDDGKSLKVGEMLVGFHVISDSGILSDSRFHKSKEPDGLSMPVSIEDSTSVMQVFLATPTTECVVDWYGVIWPRIIKSGEAVDASEPELNAYYPVEKKQSFTTSGFEMPLSALLKKDAQQTLENLIREEQKKLGLHPDQLNAA